jgi:hypothetical protein
VEKFPHFFYLNPSSPAMPEMKIYSLFLHPGGDAGQTAGRGRFVTAKRPEVKQIL